MRKLLYFISRNFMMMVVDRADFFVNCLSLKVIKLFLFSAQLSMKFKLLINIQIAKICGIFKFKSPKPNIYPANKYGILTFMSRIHFMLS